MGTGRASYWRLGKTGWRLPLYFPSVSSLKTNLSAMDYVSALNRLAEKGQYLVSAYDLMRCDSKLQEELVNTLQAAKNANTLVLVDSGNYESFWKAPGQPWTSEEFHDCLRIVKPVVAFGFDQQNPPANKVDHLRQLNVQFDADRSVEVNTKIIPIVHGSAGWLKNICPEFSRDQKLEAIAVAERSLGAGVFERMKAVQNLRNALDQTGSYTKLHLLGTGNPISIALYAIAGADSFDGLEWCQTVVDHETALLHHFTHGDFFRQQTKWGNADISYNLRTLAHNLEFYRDWMSRLATAIDADDGERFCRHNFPERIYVQCEAEFSKGKV